MVVPAVSSTLISEVILIAIIAIILYVIFTVGKGLFKLLFGIIANSVLGLLAIFVLNYFFNLQIPIKLYVL
ncbi:MAG: hypothetical protein ABR981_06045, partial [Candidatus Micrarchaeaceae archaeon]